MKKLLLLLIPILLTSCKKDSKDTIDTATIVENSYILESNKDGVLVEKFDSIYPDINKYNHNNKVFKVGSTFTYGFEHLSPTGDVFYFKRDPKDAEKWFFVPQKDTSSAAYKSLIITTMSGNPAGDPLSTYNKTVLQYQLNGARNFTSIGGIENEGNVWIYPPHEAYFRILELNPFPYIKAPYKVGTSWTGTRTMGSFWSDTRWKSWEGRVDLNYTYSITAKKTIETALGSIDCYVIESTATSRLGTTSLVAYFNETYGFVTLDYTNIDGSKTVLKLTAHTH